MFIASVYDPVDEVEQTDLINTLNFIMSSVTNTAGFIGGYDVNDNIGIRTNMYRKTLGPWRIDNRNMKGIRLLGFFIHNQMKVTTRFFKKISFVTWISFSKARYTHMLDVISVSETFSNV